jgi:hypothetical protein
METGLLLDVFLFLFISHLLFISFDLGPVQMASARVFSTIGVSQVEVAFPCTAGPPKGHPEQCQSVP